MKPKTVLITGTSSGIGEAYAFYLDTHGFRVFAGVRRAEDGDRLSAKASRNLTPVILDVVLCQNSTDGQNVKRRRRFATRPEPGKQWLQLATRIRNMGPDPWQLLVVTVAGWVDVRKCAEVTGTSRQEGRV